MKSMKLLLLSTLMFVVPAVAMDRKQLYVFANESMQNAHKALIDAIEKCDQNDGKHALRMDALRDSTYSLSAVQNKYLLDLYAEAAQWKSFQSHCNDCKNIDLFIRAGIDTFSKEIEARRGNISVIDLAIEAKKRSENK